VTLTDSTISGNTAVDDGGGIATVSNLDVTRTAISDNSVTGTSARGGGLLADGTVALTDSTISGNTTYGIGGNGGGVFAIGDISGTNLTVTGNSTLGVSSRGGGIAGLDGVTLINSTVSGNTSFVYGGGVYSLGFYGDDLEQVTNNGAAISLTGGNIVGDTFTVDGASPQTGITAAQVFATTQTVTSGTQTATAGVLGDNQGPVHTTPMWAIRHWTQQLDQMFRPSMRAGWRRSTNPG